MTRHSLSGVLENRRWLWRDEPFAHLVATRVFTPDVYAHIEAAIEHRLERPGEWGKVRSYDATGMQFAPDLEKPLRIFTSRAWHDMLAGLFEVRATGEINAGLHHHAVGSAHGHIHNDLNVGWFADYESADGIVLSRHELCAYISGEPQTSGVRPRRAARAVAMIFYAANPPWSRGDGGETGLYRSGSDQVGHPEATVPPVNNSLLAFECSPWTFHGFISNRRHTRTSVILWLHRAVEDVGEQWGEDALEGWKHDPSGLL